jgi:hypothetical protein
MLAATAALRRTRLPGPVAAVALGGVFVVVDSILADLGEARDAVKTPEAAATPDVTAAEDAPT